MVVNMNLTSVNKICAEDMPMMNEPIARSFSLKDYLAPRDLSENLKLSNDISFHWANWDVTCMAQKKHYKNFNNNFYLIKLNQSLQELKLRPVWFCNKVNVIKSDLNSLYESYLDSRLRLTWFERKKEILYSFESEQGPYYTLTSMKWFDNKIYSQFVMRKILLDHYTLRSFRLNANIPLVLKFNNDVNEYINKVQIHQLSEVGFILKIKDKNFINKMMNANILDLKIPVAHYRNVDFGKVEEAFQKLDQQENELLNEYLRYKLDARVLNFYGNINNAKRSAGEEFYVFARYEDLVPDGHQSDFKNIFSPLVENTKNYFEANLEEIEKIKNWKKCA